MHEIDIKLQISKTFLFFTLVLIVSSFAITCWVPLPGYSKALLCSSVLIYGSFIFWRIVLRQAKDQIHRISYNGKAWIFQNQRSVFSAQLLGETTLTQFFSILHCIQPNKQKITCVVFRDMMSDSEYRKFLIALKTRE